MYGLKGNKERMRKKFIGEKMGSDKGTKRSILNLKKNKKKKPVQKKNIGKMLETFSPAYSIMKGKGPISGALASLGRAAGPLSPLGQLAKQRRDKAKKREMEMRGSNRMTEMQRMMAGGPMKRTRPIDGIARKGKTKAV